MDEATIRRLSMFIIRKLEGGYGDRVPIEDAVLCAVVDTALFCEGVITPADLEG